jgi:NAD(P)-dependent dehydrogenase (short-subunit alcohol dehydrogenase family)
MPAGKVALVTGASRGIGRGIAEALATRGWRIAINYRANEQAAEETRALVAARGGSGFCIQADVGRLEDHERLVRAVLEHYGHVDLLVNNAGMAPRQRVDMLRVGQDSYDEIMQTNLKGPFFLTQRVAQHMIARLQANTIEAPQIVNITSISAVASSTHRAEYCLSKAGLSMMTALWAHRLAEYGIGVHEVRPGVIETDMTAGVKEKYDRLILQAGLTLLQRWGRPSDVGKAVLAVAEGLLPYSTGEVIYVDGGLHVPRL